MTLKIAYCNDCEFLTRHRIEKTLPDGRIRRENRPYCALSGMADKSYGTMACNKMQTCPKTRKSPIKGSKAYEWQLQNGIINNKKMEVDEYQQKAMTTCMPSSHNICYMTYGLCEESGEVAGKISKGIRKGIVTIDDVNLVRLTSSEEEYKQFEDALKKEAGDVMWMVAGLCSVMGWKLSEVCQDNLDKLQDRQLRKVIDGVGDNR